MKKLLLIPFLLFSSLILHSQINFQEHYIFTTLDIVDGPRSVYAADIDGDGKIDAVSASTVDNKIAWYRNLDGLGAFGSQKVVSTNAAWAVSVIAVDLDGDNDIDLLSAANEDNKIAWYENLDGLGNFGQERVISTEVAHVASVFAQDLDGDGDLDVISASYSDNKIAWYENLDGMGNFGFQRIITLNDAGANSVYSIDIDGDGDMDILAAASIDDQIAWYENLNGQGNFSQQKTITSIADGAKSVFATDLDGDGDIDVLSASSIDNKIAWYENIDGMGNFGPQLVITTLASQANFVYASDLDGDGDMDVLSTSFSDDKISYYRNYGQGVFSNQQIISLGDGASSVHTADLDGDGDQDVLSALDIEDKLEWYENTDGNADFSTQKVISLTSKGTKSVYATDLDEDGDIDVISASKDDDTCTWYENTDGLGNFTKQHNISTTVGGAQYVVTSDLNGDGYNDVVLSQRSDGELSWHANTNGLGDFTEENIIMSNTRVRTINPCDIDGDGDMDIVCDINSQDTVGWFENLDGLGSFSALNVIGYINEVNYVHQADIDNDGDIDVLGSSIISDTVAWYENLDGQGSFGPQQDITTSLDRPTVIYASDLDNDGDMDVISSSNNNSLIVWFENLDGLGNFGQQQIITNEADEVTEVFTIDIDNDGDLDLLSTSSNDYKLAWYENQDSQGNFGSQQIISSTLGDIQSVFSIDIDNDGDHDVIAAGGSYIIWYENLSILNINEHFYAKFNVFPNPTNDILKIDSITTVVYVTIYSITGRVVLDKQDEYGIHNIDLTELEQGLYLIRAEDKNGEIGLKKVVKN